MVVLKVIFFVVGIIFFLRMIVAMNEAEEKKKT
jgi:hypothetical protein